MECYPHRILKAIIISSVIFFISFLSTYGESQLINVIRVEGNKYTSTKKILSLITSRPGEEYSENKIRLDIKRITNIGNFTNVSFDISNDNVGVVIAFIVVEKFLIKNINFKGNHLVTDVKLKYKIKSEENKSFNQEDILNDVNTISGFYKDAGYLNTVVEASPEFYSDNRKVAITFYIEEGVKTEIHSINIYGAKSYKTDKLKSLMCLKKGRIYKKDELDKAIKKIEEFYKNKGYVYFEITGTDISFNNENTEANITININEGKLYRFGKITLKGNIVYRNKELLKLIKYKPNKIYSKERLDLSLANIRETYAEKGYFRANIIPEYIKINDNNIVDIILNINEGEIFYLNKIILQGNDFIKENVIKREFLLKEGEVFNIKKLRRSTDKIYNLGYFRDLNIKYDTDETHIPNTINIILTVEEQTTGSVYISAGPMTLFVPFGGPW